MACSATLTRALGAVDFRSWWVLYRHAGAKEAQSFLSGSLDAMRLTETLVYGAADTIEVDVPPAPPGVLQLYWMT